MCAVCLHSSLSKWACESLYPILAQHLILGMNGVEMAACPFNSEVSGQWGEHPNLDGKSHISPRNPGFLAECDNCKGHWVVSFGEGMSVSSVWEEGLGEWGYSVIKGQTVADKQFTKIISCFTWKHSQTIFLKHLQLDEAMCLNSAKCHSRRCALLSSLTNGKWKILLFCFPVAGWKRRTLGLLGYQKATRWKEFGSLNLLPSTCRGVIWDEK